MYNSFPHQKMQILQFILNLRVHVTKIMDNFIKNCLERMKEFQTDILVFFITSWAYATVKVTMSGVVRYAKCHIQHIAICIAIMLQLYCNILQYAFLPYCFTPIDSVD